MINHQQKKKMIVYHWPQYVIWHDWANETKATIYRFSENKNRKNIRLYNWYETGNQFFWEQIDGFLNFIWRFYLSTTRKFVLQRRQSEWSMVIGIFMKFFRHFITIEEKITRTINIYYSSCRRPQINSMFHNLLS